MNMIDIANSINFVSINMLIRLIYQVNLDIGRKQFKILLNNVDWKKLINNAKTNGLINIEEGQKGYTAKTISGENLLEVCIDNEKDDDEWNL